MATVFRRGQTWWIRFQYRGQRVERSARTTNRNEALKVLVRAQEEVRRRDLHERVPHSFVELADRYRAEHLPTLRPNTQCGYRHTIDILVRHFGRYEVEQIGRPHIAAFVSARRQEGRTSSTIRRNLASLSSMYSCAISWDWADRNPVRAYDKRMIRENPPRVRYLTPTEYQALLKVASPTIRPIIALAVQTGMRQGELLSLTWAQIDLNRREITLPTTKSGRPRVVPLSTDAVATVAAIPRYPGSPDVFHNPFTGRPIRHVQTAFSNALRRAGIVDFRFHDLRHTFASWSVQAGMDLYRLSRILGHTSTQMTTRYAHLSTKELHQAIADMATNTATRPEQGWPHEQIDPPQP